MSLLLREKIICHKFLLVFLTNLKSQGFYLTLVFKYYLTFNYYLTFISKVKMDKP